MCKKRPSGAFFAHELIERENVMGQKLTAEEVERFRVEKDERNRRHLLYWVLKEVGVLDVDRLDMPQWAKIALRQRYKEFKLT